jgi:hypothetical protein
MLVLLLLALRVASFAQSTSWDWKDSSVVPTESLSQYHEFLQNKNPYPVKPRNAWEFGVSAGLSNMTGDVEGKLGYGYSFTARKALNNIFSYRIGYYGSVNNGKGDNNDYTGYRIAYPYITGSIESQRYYDYKNYSHNWSFDLIASVNTFSNYRGDPTGNLYVFAGVGFTRSATKVNNNGINIVNGVPVQGQGWEWIKIPEKDFFYVDKNKRHYFLKTYDFGGGYAWKINKKWNLGFEERINVPFKNVGYLDGFNAQKGTKNVYFYTAFKLNFNLLK